MTVKKVHKKKVPTLGGSYSTNKASKRSGKKGCLFWVVLLFLLAWGVHYKSDLVIQYVPQYSVVESYIQSMMGGILEPAEPEGVEEPIIPLKLESLPVMPKKLAKKRRMKAQQGEVLQYIRVGSCMKIECRIQLVQEIEALGLSSMRKQYKKQTLYYELISQERFKKGVAQLKLVEIDRYATAAPQASLSPSKGRWKVSFGEFPDKQQGVYVKSYLAQLYPDIDIAFKLIPKRRHFKVEYIYAGPFSSRFNAESVVELLRDKRFIQETWVTSRP